ncbi:MAG: DUF2809 domain-containing protein [Hoeflea sp.]|uniref:ribosomal maturation YjgA family protein n=1 Tax=Hoeflea sp. TaxID=1940281 RepID=UPI0032F07F5E
MDEIKAHRELRIRRLLIALAVIAAGLTLRLTGYEIGLPYVLVKYGGSLLWGMMVFWVVAIVLPGQSVIRISLVAGIVALLTEFSRLYQTPWLDQFRLQLVGALLLGRIFSGFNILAYLAEIGLAALVERRIIEGRRSLKA